MISMGKQVFLYCLDKSIIPTVFNAELYEKVQDFMKRHKDKGVFFKISDEKDLVIKFRENLELYFDGIIKGSEFKKSTGSKKIYGLMIDLKTMFMRGNC